ncbi:MAG: DUF4364 family protein [Clostridiaceae bacterium]|nr:DUF4364 family protein [Clostridiaceae bacterium]
MTERAAESPGRIVVPKVLLLYITNEHPGINDGQLITLALQSCYTDYFTYVEASTELVQTGLLSRISPDTANINGAGIPQPAWYITEAGKQVLETLRSEIPPALVAWLQHSGLDLLRRQQENAAVLARAEYSPDGNPTSRLSLNEAGRSIIDLIVTWPSLALAEEACRHWQKNAPQLYPQLLQLLNPEAAGDENVGMDDELPHETNTTDTDI